MRARTNAALLLIAMSGLTGCSLGGDESTRPPALGTKSDDKQAVIKLGFPSSATKNTIRIGGGDATSDAAGVASALFPATTNANRPTAVVLVDKDDWQAGVTASVLAGRPIGAPLLVSDGDKLPQVSRDTLKRLKPTGSDLSKDAQVIRIGDKAARPDGFKTAVIEGKDPYERGAAIDRFFSAARGKPSGDVVVTSGEQAEYAMPAAAWGARSGNAVLLTKKDSVPAATQKAIRSHSKPNIYVLGPPSAVSDKAVAQLRELGAVVRIQGPTPVSNAVAFARYRKGGFGWGVVVPGYNFTVASTSRPLDAGAAAALGTRGVFAPLLLTDKAKTVPKPLEDYLLSVQPGYENDPGQAVYNRVWILGDDKEISVKAQARLDQITELIPVQSNAP
ncbi:MAG: cell wall-binding repeat-containing protein [Thermoleophilaceae bacterium]